MTLKDYFKKNLESGLWSIEIITFIYMIYTTILTFAYWPDLNDPWGLIKTRLTVIATFALSYAIYRAYPCRAIRVIRVIAMLLFLISWYPETYDFCSQLPYQDHVFAAIDNAIFGFQPALEFCKTVTSTFWCEAFNMGYYLYYYMMTATLLFYLLWRYEKSDKAGFVFLTSFFLFYIIYEWLPVAGPQYYFKAVGEECAALGTFPDVGYYFRTHTECLTLDVRGIFSQLVLGAQEIGERPTAAFPSSHVGMSTVTMIMAYRSGNKPLFYIMLPIYILLCCGTVYIKAHYCIDSIAGFFFAGLFYWISYKIYDKLMVTKYRKLVGKE
ncbi:MAG: phosphatase PAP2 family protein [Bacteroidaceae bacterium]|nr:phosphatase PAP2 family protein [Bacteroidaceae bacterium]